MDRRPLPAVGTVGPVEATERFAELMTAPERELRLDQVALLIAAHAYPDLDLDRELGRLDDLADRCFAPTLDALVRHLFVDEGFTGNRRDYFDPRNSYLNQVTQRRLGIPISLSVLTIEVGRRLGVPLSGVGMPGHFLLRDRVDPEVFVDPFARGALLGREQCERAFRAINGDEAPFDDAYLEPVGAWAITARILANLKMIHTRRNDRRALVWVLGLRCLVPGMPVSEFGEWATALAAVGEYRRAAEILEDSAERAGEAGDSWRATAAALRARLN